MVGVAGLAVIAAVAAVAVGGRRRPPAPLRVALASSYSVTYRVVQNGAPRWEVLTVQRPLAASDLSYGTAAAPGPGDAPSSGTVSTPTALYSVDADGVHAVSGRQPGPPSGDQLLVAELSDLQSRRLAVDLHTGMRVAGDPCRVYRFFDPPSGPIHPVTSGGDHDDLCLDGGGVVLWERWRYHGKVVLERTAVRAVSGSDAAAGGPGAPATVGASAAPPGAATVTPDAQPVSFLAAPPVPAGYDASGPPVAFRLPEPQLRSATAATSVVWAFVDGPRVISVEAGSEAGGGVPWVADDTVTEPIVLTRLGPATTACRSDGAEVRVDLGGRWVRVRGSVTVGELVAYGRTLSLAPGAGGSTAG